LTFGFHKVGVAFAICDVGINVFRGYGIVVRYDMQSEN